MGAYAIYLTAMYDGYIEVNASNEDDALDSARTLIENSINEFPDEVHIGPIGFSFSEATADMAVRLKSEQNEDIH